MSVAEVQGRIAEIHSRIALLGVGRSNPTSATAFASSLSDASASASTGLPAGSTTGEQVVDLAKQSLGVPYVWGGNSLSTGMDCSGLVQQVYKQFGIELPRLSADQAKAGTPVPSLAEAKPGDLIAWDNASRNNGADHIAIYIGDGKMIEAPRTGLNVRIVDVPSTPDYIRRVLPDSSSAQIGGVAFGRVMDATGATSPTAGVSPATPYASLFNSASAKYDVSAKLLAAVAKQESGFNGKAVSPAGAQGLMQLMPGTAKGLGVTNSFDPAQSVDGAARLLKGLINEFGRVDLALAAYNAGPGAVKRYDGIPPYPETQKYVRNILANLNGS